MHKKARSQFRAGMHSGLKLERLDQIRRTHHGETTVQLRTCERNLTGLRGIQRMVAVFHNHNLTQGILLFEHNIQTQIGIGTHFLLHRLKTGKGEAYPITACRQLYAVISACIGHGRSIGIHIAHGGVHQGFAIGSIHITAPSDPALRTHQQNIAVALPGKTGSGKQRV